MNKENEIKEKIIDLLLNEYELEVKSERWEDIILNRNFVVWYNWEKNGPELTIDIIRNLFKEIFNIDLFEITEIHVSDRIEFNFYLFYEFGERAKLEHIIMNDNIDSIPFGALDNLDRITSIKLPANLKVIDTDAFLHCSSLKSIEIPDGVTSIGYKAFYECESLTSVKIPNSVTYIDDYAFCGCSWLKDITIPSNIKSIGEFAFRDCELLKNITIPNSIEYLGCDVFYNCIGLTDIIIPERFKDQMWKFFTGVDLTKIKIHYI